MAKASETSNLIEELMITIGLDKQTSQDCIRYMAEGVETEMVPARLPTVLLRNARNREGNMGSDVAWSLIRKMRKKEEEPTYIGRLVTVMLYVGGESFLDASAGYVEDALWRRGCLSIITQYDIPLSIVWEWFLKNSELHRFDRLPEEHSIAFMDLVAKHRPDLIHNRISELPRSSQLYLVVSLQKYQNERDKTIGWFEREFLQYVEEELLKHPQTTEIATDIMDAILKGKEDVIQHLMQHVEWDYDTILQWVHKAVYLAVETDGTISVSKWFNRFLILWSPSLFYELYLYVCWGDREKKLRQLPALLATYGVTHEYYLRLLAKDDRLNDLLHEELARDKDCFIRAILQSEKLETKHLCLILWETTEDRPFLDLLEEQLLNVVEDVLVANGVSDSDLLKMRAFFQREPLTEELKSIFHQFRKTPDSSFYNLLSAAENLYGHSEMFNRIICIMTYLDDQRSSYLGRRIMKNGLNCSEFVEVFRNAGGETRDLLPLLVENAQYDQYKPDDFEWQEMTLQYLKDNLRELSNDLEQLLVTQVNDKKTKNFLLELLVRYDQPIYIVLAVKYLADDSKWVRDKSIQLLELCPNQIEGVVNYLTHKKPAIRESVVQLLCKWNTVPSREALKDLWAREKSEKIKALITNTLQLKPESDSESLLYRANLSKGVLEWLALEKLPRVRLREVNTFVDESMVRAILYSYVVQEEIMMNWTAHELAGPLQSEDLADLANEILKRWLADGAEMKKKWVLAFATMFGDERVVISLQSWIQAWPNESRGVIACEAVRALILSPLNTALVFVDQISRKFKFKQVKQVAIKAMSHAATALEISPDELADRIVPTFGFDRNGRKRLVYGDRHFTIQLLNNCQLHITDDNEKSYKALPASIKSDDPEQVRGAQAEYKLLKKQVKSVYQSMRVRLDQTFSNRRKWRYSTWEKLFVDNPLLHSYAIGFIWGCYEVDQLLFTFRHKEKGIMISFDEQEVRLTEGTMIGLVHPLELEDSERDSWQEQLREYEIIQPTAQLNRNIFSVSNEDEQSATITRFAGFRINGLSLLGNMSKFGWSRGSIVDGGCYYELYKENEDIGIGVNLAFSGTSVDCEDEIVTIYDIVFYQVGKVRRGSYIYSKIKDCDRIPPMDIPVYYFSEILYEVDFALVKRIGVVEDWRSNIEV